MLTVNIECIKHRRYKAMREPKADCGTCWFMWYLLHKHQCFHMAYDLRDDVAPTAIVVERAD